MPVVARVPLVSIAVVVPLYALWAFWLATGGGDLAAQLAWAGFMERHPASAYNLSWYGGTHTANYSLLAPPLMAVFGVRAVSVAAGLVGTWVLARLFVRSQVPRPVWPAVLGAVALWCNVASGRTTFALGVAIGLLVLLYVRRTAVAALCTALAAMASPVAGLFLVVAGAAYLLDRQWRKAAALVLPPFVVVGVVTLLFPFQGEQPMATGKLWMPLAASAAVAVAAPRGHEWRVVRYGAAVYGLGVVLTYLIASPIGTNVERLVGLVGPPVLLAAVLTAGLGRFLRAVLAAALALNTYWLIDKTNDDLLVSNDVPAWAAHTDGVVRELERLGAGRTRVEVVPARNHREASLLAPHINMARGWNRQLDVERGRLFYDGALTPATYRQWLDRWAVGLVVLHHGRPDGPAEAEAAIVRSGPGWLERVWQDEGWSVYRVRDAVPLVSSPATVVRGDDAELVVRMPAAGSVRVRVAYSPWLRARGACLRQEGEWTRLTVPRAGEYRLDSPYRLSRSADSDC
ncbi:glycosyltransferase family 87 protein [Streptomyces sp.]|uniref:glycosyltransferase family 87 protein n=1 Tax=Streptomyces sp. TaxID=1931 RepID=UPI002D7967B0|nr:glycosyltransferase family 87 protein [Streptomyces sp.]HET6358807.1 glycosyltransferase family 87 protein [Streptomyces sp.]